MIAWDLLTPEVSDKLADGWAVRLVGGRTLYDSARNTQTDNVMLSRLGVRERASDHWLSGLHLIRRYIKHDTPVELVRLANKALERNYQ